MNNPRFSIITITYNSGKTIERTIKSILAQSNKDFEYIIVDGASKDNTLEIIKVYEPMFEGRMKWESEPDNGIYDAMNKGIMRSTGNIIGIVNSDDWLEENSLDVVGKLADSNNNAQYSLYCGSINFHYENGSSQVFFSDESRFLNGIPRFSYNYGVYHPAVFVSRYVYEKIGNFDDKMRIIADIEFIYRSYIEGMKFKFTDEILSNMSDGGASNNINLRVYYNDKKVCMQKYHQNSLNDYLKLYRVMGKLFIKQYLPESILKVIRGRYFNNK